LYIDFSIPPFYNDFEVIFMSIGARIKERREQLGITQIELADRLGVTKGAVGNYETDANSPKASIMYKIFEILQCDANYLYQDEIVTQESTKDAQLLSLFHDLNEEGQEKLIDYADDIVRSGKYKKISGAVRMDTGTV
jgi:transcriptional regulator with XRE-family HTH domain